MYQPNYNYRFDITNFFHLYKKRGTYFNLVNDFSSVRSCQTLVSQMRLQHQFTCMIDSRPLNELLIG